MAKNYIHTTRWALPTSVSTPLQKIKAGVFELKQASNDNNKQFTLDGRLVGDIGELLAEYFFKVTLHPGQLRGNDGEFYDAQNRAHQVEVKCRRMSSAIWFDSEPEFLIVFKIHPSPDDSKAPENCTLVYAGPGSVLHKVRGQIEYEDPKAPFPKKFKGRQTISLNQLAKHFDYASFMDSKTIPLNNEPSEMNTSS